MAMPTSVPTGVRHATGVMYVIFLLASRAVAQQSFETFDKFTECIATPAECETLEVRAARARRARGRAPVAAVPSLARGASRRAAMRHMHATRMTTRCSDAR